MRAKHLPKHPRILSTELARLTLDSDSERRFDHQYRPALFGGIFLGCTSMLVGYVLFRAGTLSSELGTAVGAVGVLPGLAIAFSAHRRMLYAKPLSVHTGHPMRPFVIEDREMEDRIDLAYIDEISGTYFIRSYAA